MTELAAKKTQLDNKLSAARTRLIIDNPFLGSLVLHFPLIAVQESWCKTIATDNQNFYYNPDYISLLNLEETQFVLSHEALHCGLCHFNRKQSRVKTKWDIACDYAVNSLLVNENLSAPKGTLYLPQFDSLCAEEIYLCIEDNDDSDLLDNHLYGESESDQQQDNPPPLVSTSSLKSQSIEWKKRMATAAHQAKMAGKLSAQFSRMIGKLIRPSISWRELLANHISMLAKDDYSYSRPSSRRDGNVIFPGIRSQMLNLVVALDTSGSVSMNELQQFSSELNHLKSQQKCRITTLYCDSEISLKDVHVIEPWEEMKCLSNISGGGGTQFEPVFDWIDKNDIPPDLLIYFTDGMASFPKQPSYPVIWMIKGATTPPWGVHIKLSQI